MSDEDDPKALRERVRELEQTADDLRETVEQLQQRRGPSRRDLLKVGSGGLLGAGLLASSQPVSAAPASSDTSAGQVGVAGDSEDMVLDQLYDPGGDEILNVDDSGGINAQFGREWYFDSASIENTDTDLLSLGSPTTREISSGTLDISNISYVSVRGEGGSDDSLDDLNGTAAGKLAILESDGQTITVVDGVTMILGGRTDKTLTETDKLGLIDRGDGVWEQIFYSQNDA
jgi:hypothetical protein